MRETLHASAINGNSAEVKRLLKQPDIDINAKDENGWTPLHLAAYGGYKNIVELLIKKGVDIEILNSKGQTPVQLARENGKEEIAQLIEKLHQKEKEYAMSDKNIFGTGNITLEEGPKGIKYDMSDIGSMPRYTANFSTGHVTITKHISILDLNPRKFDMEYAETESARMRLEREEWTPLHKAAYSGHELKKVEQMIDRHGVDPLDRNQCTPLHQAASQGRTKVAKLLIHRKANVNAQNNSQNTPLHFAAESGQIEMVKLLIKNDADVNAKNDYQNTSLHFAAANGHTGVVEFLIKRGADTKALNNEKKTPEQLAMDKGEEEVVQLIRNLETKNDGEGDKQTLKNSEEETKIISIEYKDLNFGRKLGRGGYGIVYEGEWILQPNSKVAIKELSVDPTDEEKLRKIRREMKIMYELQSPYIVRFYGACFKQDGEYYLVMEYLSEGPLNKLLYNADVSWDINWKLRYQIAMDITQGIAYLHEHGVVHGDLKGENVLLYKEEEVYRAKVSDFGESKLRNIATDTTVTGPSGATGTDRWKAPELLLDPDTKSTKESDMYSYGMTLWELGSRKRPFDEKKPLQVPAFVGLKGAKEEITPDTPPSMAKLIGHCWKERTERPTIEEAVSVLDNEQKGLITK